MARARKKHVQQAFEFRSHGGKREGAGRKPKGKRSSEPHKQRQAIDPRFPLHVVTRVAEDLGSLRKRDLYRAICEATVAVFQSGTIEAARGGTSAETRHGRGHRRATAGDSRGPRPRSFGRTDGSVANDDERIFRLAGFRIVHASVQRNHLHLLVEADGKEQLSAGMQALLGSAAQRINRAVWRRTGERRRGCVFTDRYYALPLKTPRQVRNCLSYVLNNWRRHGEDRFERWNVDAFSTGIWFPGWKERAEAPLLYVPPRNYVWMMTWLPKTWLLREGWKLHPPVSLREVPGPLEQPRRPRPRPSP